MTDRWPNYSPIERAERSWWGWGTLDAALSDDDCRAYGALLPGLAAEPCPVPLIGDLELPPPRVVAPQSLAVITSSAPAERAAHAHGKAYRDVMRSLAGEVAGAPDLVVHPGTEDGVVDVLDWASSAGVIVVPYGGGSSVVGGVEYRGVGPWLSLDLTGMDRVLEIDATSRAARVQAGVLGPRLEEQLRPHGYTLRFFPQSFEFSSLGGWLATRAGGHFATGPTHIDDLVESLRVITPIGPSESFRLPGSGAGPSPDRMFLGSEGILGVITEAWLRLQDRPTFKAATTVAFPDMSTAMTAVRVVAQSGLNPANCRLLDPGEAALSAASTSGDAVLVLGVESAHVPVDSRLAELVTLARDHGGTPAAVSGPTDDAAQAWRGSFLRMPYLRDGLARMGAIVETFETACTWDRADAVYEDVRSDIASAVHEVTGRPGLVNCRFTHVYPDGPAPYFTVIGVGRAGEHVRMWDEIKAAAMEISPHIGPPSPTTMRSDGTTGRVMTGSDRIPSQSLSRRPSTRLTRPASSTPASSSVRNGEVHPGGSAEQRLDRAVGDEPDALVELRRVRVGRDVDPGHPVAARARHGIAHQQPRDASPHPVRVDEQVVQLVTVVGALCGRETDDLPVPRSDARPAGVDVVAGEHEDLGVSQQRVHVVGVGQRGPAEHVLQRRQVLRSGRPDLEIGHATDSRAVDM